ncbi:MAG: polyprenol monophosphomannose synthase [Okeania sp. SIO3C4]|nr:polyprenol monophosphomannose synthase [Okeania sp. SIO3C4]
MSATKPNSLLTVPTGLLQVPTVVKNTIKPDSPEIKLSLVIPTFKESQNIPKIVQRLTQLLDAQIPHAYELIVVDDNSPDLTWEKAQNMTPEYPQLQVMRREKERGLSTAVIRGWQVAKGEILGVIDADLQHPPETILKLLTKMEQGADLAVASRHFEEGGVSEWNIMRRLLSRGAQVLGLIILPGVVGRVSDPMSGYFMVRRKAIAEKILRPVGYKILIEVLGRGSIHWVGEVGYIFNERVEGESKVTWKQYIEYLHHLLNLRLARWPSRFICFGTVVFIVFNIFSL